MVDRRNVLTPDALGMLDAIARSGSFAAAARELGKVPSALTYSVRQLEDALDVLLFDRSSRQAQFTPAGIELLLEGRRLLAEMDAVSNRVRRVASGWESQLVVVSEDLISQTTLYELVEAFCVLRLDSPVTPARSPSRPERSRAAPVGDAPHATPGTRLRLARGVLTGTWEMLVSGEADLAIGVAGDPGRHTGIELRPLAEVNFLFAVAPHHALATSTAPVGDEVLVRYRAIAVADSAHRLPVVSRNLLPGQDVLTVPTMRAKLEALLRGLGCGFVPEPMARPHLEAGRLVSVPVARGNPVAPLYYAWRAERGPGGLGRALQWWLLQLESPTTRSALVERHGSAY